MSAAKQNIYIVCADQSTLGQILCKQAADHFTQQEHTVTVTDLYADNFKCFTSKDDFTGLYVVLHEHVFLTLLCKKYT